MHSMRSFQRQVELRRLGNQLPVLGKANSLFKFVKCCAFFLFVKLRVSPHCVGLVIKISGVIVARAKSMYRTDLLAMYSVAPHSVPLFRSLMSTPMRWCGVRGMRGSTTYGETSEGSVGERCCGYGVIEMRSTMIGCWHGHS